jgi:hypothetical protein
MKKIFLPIYQLSSLRQEPEAMAERVQYLLEDDRFLCPEGSYQVKVNSTDTYEGSIDSWRTKLGSYTTLPRTRNRRGYLPQVLRG